MSNLTQALVAVRQHSSKAASSQAGLQAAIETLAPAAEAAAAAANKQKAIMQALKYIGIGGAGGFALRGIQGMVEQPRRNLKKPIEGTTQFDPIDVPVSGYKMAGIGGELGKGLKNIGGGISDWIGGHARELGSWAADTAKETSEGLSGYRVTDPRNHPIAIAGGIGGGAAAGLAGYKLHDMILDKLRKRQLEEELQQAKQDYEGALSDKVASGDSLAADLDELVDAMEKVSNGDTLGRLGGAYALYALLTGAMGASASYGHYKKKQRRTLLEEATKKRRRQKYKASPTPLFARPMPVDEPEAVETPDPFKSAPSLATTENQFG